MCLETIYKDKQVWVREAFKVFEKDRDGKLRGIFYNFKFKKRRWIEDTNSVTLPKYSCMKDDQYLSGFHCFVEKEFALSYYEPQHGEVCHRVLAKDIVASGLQCYCDKKSLTVVARKTYIMEEVKREENPKR